MFALLAFTTAIGEAAFGYPAFLLQRIGHPVIWIGAVLGKLERRFNDPRVSEKARRRRGFFCLLLVLMLSVGCTEILCIASERLLTLWIARFLQAACASTLLAQRSLYTHVAAVQKALNAGGCRPARKALSHIVGRDVDKLDTHAIARSAIESLAENFSDAVIAPVFWLFLLGLPGIVAYKVINTADSMIGHLTERYRDFGRAAALIDDAANYPAARLSALALFFAGSHFSARHMRYMARVILIDARQHRSPNAGWPEAAMSAWLRVRLSGPRSYDGRNEPNPWIGRGRHTANERDLAKALALYRRACLLSIVFLALLSVTL